MAHQGKLYPYLQPRDLFLRTLGFGWRSGPLQCIWEQYSHSIGGGLAILFGNTSTTDGTWDYATGEVTWMGTWGSNMGTLVVQYVYRVTGNTAWAENKITVIKAGVPICHSGWVQNSQGPAFQNNFFTWIGIPPFVPNPSVIEQSRIRSKLWSEF